MNMKPDISIMGWLQCFLPEPGAGFGQLTVPLLLQHLGTLLSSVGRQLDAETLPGLLSLHGVPG